MLDQEADSTPTKKQSALLTKLRSKFMLTEQDELPDINLPSKGKQFSRPGNKNAYKNKRKIQIGLKLNGKHIRKVSTGGGKREVKISKFLGRAAIIEKGKGFFFPELGRFGPAENFTFELENFEENKIDGRHSIGEMYEATGLPLLRFYLCANSIKKEDHTVSSVTNADKPKPTQTSVHAQASTVNKAHTVASAAGSSATYSSEAPTGTLGAGSCSSATASAVFSLSPGISVSDFLTNPHSFEFRSQESHEKINSEDFFPKPETPTLVCSPNFVDLGTPTVQARDQLVSSVLTDTRVDDSTDDEQLPIVNDLLNYVDDQGHPVALVADAANGSERHNDSVPQTQTQKIKLHRGHVLKELTEFYRENDVSGTLEVQMIMPNGKPEAGEDFGGVLRDTLSEYWEDFYLMNTTGENVKVPCVRDNMKKEDWQACAKVLVMGYKQEGYFPYKLAQPFLQYTMDGDDTVINREHHSLIPTFLEYVPDSDRHLLETALKNFTEVDKDDLLDVLEMYKVQRCVKADNINDIMKDAAHRILIQSTAYICRCWHALFVNELKPVLKVSLEDVCKEAIPTTKRVIDAIIMPNPTSEAERNTSKLLLKYIRSLSSDKLVAFMRYTTGGNLMLGRKVTVRFVEQTDFERRPLAHTCGCILELASSFKDYIEFRSEFNAVLEAKIWVMDIV